MKLLKIMLLVAYMLLMTIAVAVGQTSAKDIRKTQYAASYKHYKETWYKAEKKAIKQSIAATKELNQAPKARNRRNAKLAKLRNELSEVSARKEGSND